MPHKHTYSDHDGAANHLAEQHTTHPAPTTTAWSNLHTATTPDVRTPPTRPDTPTGIRATGRSSRRRLVNGSHIQHTNYQGIGHDAPTFERMRRTIARRPQHSPVNSDTNWLLPAPPTTWNEAHHAAHQRSIRDMPHDDNHTHNSPCTASTTDHTTYYCVTIRPKAPARTILAVTAIDQHLNSDTPTGSTEDITLGVCPGRVPD